MYRIGSVDVALTHAEGLYETLGQEEDGLAEDERLAEASVQGPLREREDAQARNHNPLPHKSILVQLKRIFAVWK